MPDVLQLLDVTVLSSLWIRRLKALGVPVVYTQTMVRDPTVGWAKNLLWKQSFRPVDCTVVSTEAMKDSLRSVGFDGPLRVIPNGVDTSRFCPVPPGKQLALRERIGVPSEAELVVFVGGFLSYRKGVDILASAWKAISESRPQSFLLLVGPTFDSLRPAEGQTSFLSEVRSSLESSGAMDRVAFTGPVDDVESYLQIADVFVFPSRREGMPNVVLEAYACGTASVLCPFVGISKEFGVSDKHYVASPHEPTHLADRVIGLLTDQGLRRSLGARARQWVVEGLTVARSLDSYVALYRELASRPDRS
jgi:glycosyltransferase involved in cell wall biosynthesis